MHHFFWALTRIFMMIAFLLWYSPLVWSQESSDPQLPEKLMLRGGWAHVFGAQATVAVPGRVSGVGTSIDFVATLGGDTNTDAFRTDALYRFNDRHAVGFTWYRVGLSGDKVTNQQLQVGDDVVAAGATTQTSLSFSIYRLLYNYSFYRDDKVELGISPGLYVMQTKFNFAAQGTINGAPGVSAVVNDGVTLPLPSVGLVANYNIMPKLQFQSRFDVFYVSINDYTGAMFEFYAGLEYRLFRHFAMGAAYDRLSANLRGDGDKGFITDFSYNLAYVYATLYFF